jgi:hypothetical protein
MLRLLLVNQRSPIAPNSFMYYHGMEKGLLEAPALQRRKSSSPGWRLSNQPNQSQYIAAGKLASSRRTACFSCLCFSLCDRLEQQICLSVFRVVNRNNSVKKQYVKIYLVYEDGLIINVANFCSITSHIPDLNFHRHRRQYITSHTVLISYVLTDQTSYPPKWHLYTVLSSKYRDVFLQC